MMSTQAAENSSRLAVAPGRSELLVKGEGENEGMQAEIR
jgi:hypothetical protein